MSPVQRVFKRGRSLILLTGIALLVCALAMLAGPVSHASAHALGRHGGYVYVLNNDLSGSNSITTFSRSAEGSLKLLGVTPIGGLAAFGRWHAGVADPGAR